MIADFDAAQHVLAAQPFSVLIGAALTEYHEGQATLEIPLRADLLQQFGFAHGGVLSYAADNSLTFAAGSVLGPSIVTASYSIDYLRPARGSLLRARARVDSASTSQALTRCEIFAVSEGGNETLCAAAQGIVRVITLRD